MEGSDGETELGPIFDDTPVKVTVELSASLHRNLTAYAKALGRETGQPVSDPARLIAPMIKRFMATDRGFAKSRRAGDRHSRRNSTDPTILS